MHQDRSSKFNGKLVKEWTGVEGKELGKIIESFKAYIEGAYPEYSDPVKMYTEQMAGYKVRTPFERYLDHTLATTVSYNFGNWYMFKWLKDLGVDYNTVKELPVYRLVFLE